MSQPESPPALVLNHGLTFTELFTPEGLQRIDSLFLSRLRERDAKVHDTLLAWRSGQENLTPLQLSELLLACGPVLNDFIANLFNIREALEDTRQRTLTHDPVFHFKKFFVQRRARRRLLKKEEFENFAELDEKLTRWCLRALTVPEGKAAVKGWVSFRLPEGIDHQKLVPIFPINDSVGRMAGPPEHLRARDGFKLTDPR